MKQQSLFELDTVPAAPPVAWASFATTVVYSDFEAITTIMQLHNAGLPFDLDPTYSKGEFWDGLPRPRLKFDLMPQIEEVQQADARALPLGPISLQSIMFDPPFVLKDTTNRTPTGVIEKRFSGYKTFADLMCFYREALTEFYRILQPRGILAFKCQDTVSGSKQYWSHVEVYNMAKHTGFYADDLFIRVNPQVIWSPNMANQQHARKTHCYYWLFKKPKK